MNPISRKIVDYLGGRRVGIAGFGREGRSSLAFLVRSGLAARCTVSDPGLEAEALDEIHATGAEASTAANQAEVLSGCGIVLRSPGVHPGRLAGLPGETAVTSQTDLVLRFARDRIVGVTGTKGKSTTAVLLHRIADAVGVPAVISGNIGRPHFDLLDGNDPGTDSSHWIMELSAHQLCDATASPRWAVITGFSDEHRDFFGSLEQYAAAKRRVLEYQRSGDTCIAATEGCLKAMEARPAAGVAALFAETRLVPEDAAKWRNPVSALNWPVIRTVCGVLGWDLARGESVARSFAGLPHRMEFVGERGGIRFFDDSLATTPEAALAGLRILGGVDWWIGGGFDRGREYRDLLRSIARERLLRSGGIVTGPAGQRMLREADSIDSASLALTGSKSLREAVDRVRHRGAAGEICLLSPAAASFDAFRDYAERGDRFREWALRA